MDEEDRRPPGDKPATTHEEVSRRGGYARGRLIRQLRQDAAGGDPKAQKQLAKIRRTSQRNGRKGGRPRIHPDAPSTSPRKRLARARRAGAKAAILRRPPDCPYPAHWVAMRREWIFGYQGKILTLQIHRILRPEETHE